MNYQQVEILLVEDSSADAEMTLRTLKRRGIANHIDWVQDGVEALEYLFREGRHSEREDGHPKLVLLDIKMPRMDGLQVLERMKQDARTRSIPVVMMTSSREEGDMVASYRLGVNSYVVKPVDFDQFAETIAQVGMYWMIANEAPD
ncbi:MAG: response regulator [Lysobacter sp.]